MGLARNVAILALAAVFLAGCQEQKSMVYELPADPPLERFPPFAVVVPLYLKTYGDYFDHSQVPLVLRTGDIVRLIDRSPGQETQSGVLDYWYQVEFEGVRGWAFGSNIVQVRSESAARLQAGRITAKVLP